MLVDRWIMDFSFRIKYILVRTKVCSSISNSLKKSRIAKNVLAISLSFDAQISLSFGCFLKSFYVLVSFCLNLFVFYYIKIHFRHRVNKYFPKN